MARELPWIDIHEREAVKWSCREMVTCESTSAVQALSTKIMHAFFYLDLGEINDTLMSMLADTPLHTQIASITVYIKAAVYMP